MGDPTALVRAAGPPTVKLSAVHDPAADFATVLDRAKRGESDALGELWRRYQPAVLAVLRHRADDPEDVSSEVWIAAARGLPRFEGDEDRFRAWLFTIVRTRTIDAARHRARRPTVALEDERQAPTVAGADDDLVTLTAGQRARDLIERVLPADQAEIVLLRVVAGLSAQEVGDITGRTAGAIRVAQHRALQALAKHLGDEHEVC